MLERCIIRKGSRKENEFCINIKESCNILVIFPLTTVWKEKWCLAQVVTICSGDAIFCTFEYAWSPVIPALTRKDHSWQPAWILQHIYCCVPVNVWNQPHASSVAFQTPFIFWGRPCTNPCAKLCANPGQSVVSHPGILCRSSVTAQWRDKLQWSTQFTFNSLDPNKAMLKIQCITMFGEQCGKLAVQLHR